ncbi:HAD-IIB family hydrolase [Pseudophaeobacter arcticus]|uniref:HAD-IIB family hydrolase n=1 Tax=Pseudophaeobacter arcticus TaxID=385492 RepID=UPI00248F6D70|nr:HAD-IIB family hydrolase [Pseudophaeobacter arcticus]
MTNLHRLMVFTDLDGTLIDHVTYRWDAAQQALTALQRLSAAVVLASSKTAAEIGALRSDLELEDWPAIVENGAGILSPHGKCVPQAAHYQAVRSVLDGLPGPLRRCFRGFGDVTADQLVEMTGLARPQAKLAQQRAFSEPGQWLGTAQQRSDFLAYLLEQGVTAQQGGRFLTLSFGGNKADQLLKIVQSYQPQHTIALGDAPNDIQMLEKVDFGVVVANPHRAPLPLLKGEARGQILRTKEAGPVGWNTAVLQLLDRLHMK